MNKAAPTPGRVLAMVGFALSCFGLLLFLWLAFGGSIPLAPRGYQFHVQFPEATQLAKEADVRISGVPVGKVTDLKADTKTGLTNATIELNEKYAPVPRDARAILRQKTLLGETYVELTPGSRGVKRMALPEGGSLPQAQVADTVQLDEIFRAFNPKTRLAFQQWMIRSSKAFAGRGLDLNDALGNLGPTVQDSDDLVRVLNSQEGAVRRLVRNTGEVSGALSERHGQLASLIRNSNVVFGVTARQNAALQATFRALPTFEQESRRTLLRLDQFARNTNPLVTQLRPAAVQLSPTLQDLALIAPDLQALFNDLGPLITASRAGLPAISTFLDQATPVLGQLDPFLRNLNPAIKYIGLYKEELNAFFSQTVAATQAVSFPINSKGEPVHYLRTTNPVNPENLAIYGHRLATNRPNPYPAPGASRFLKSPGYFKVFENRQCNSNVLPAAPVGDSPLLPLLDEFFFQNGVPGAVQRATAPPCVLQKSLGPQLGFGSKNYPHVAAQPPSK